MRLNPVEFFVTYCCYIDETFQTDLDSLYRAYCDWRKDSPCSRTRFNSRVSSLLKGKGALPKPCEEWESWSKKSYVYVISDGEYLKVGVSCNPYKRVKQLQTGSGRPLKLECYTEGDRSLEGRLHDALAAYRAPGGTEQFREGKKTREIIASVYREHILKSTHK